MNQSLFLAILCNSLQAREKSRVHGAIGFGFASHWLKNWRESFKPITKRSNRDHVITFDSHLKTALRIKITPYKHNEAGFRFRSDEGLRLQRSALPSFYGGKLNRVNLFDTKSSCFSFPPTRRNVVSLELNPSTINNSVVESRKIIMGGSKV